MKPIEHIKKEIDAFSSVEWAACDYPKKTADDHETADVGWVKFQLSQDKLGFRTLEFIAWIVTDMRNAGERLHFLPVSPPPHLNEPGKSLCFVLECYPKDGDQDARFMKVAEFIAWCRNEHWEKCRGA